MSAKAMAESVAETVKSYVQAACDPLHERIRALESQRATTMHYRGVWSEGDSYSSGDVVTRSGTIWFCHETTTDKPGTSDAWQMMVKSK